MKTLDIPRGARAARLRDPAGNKIRAYDLSAG